MQTKRDCLRKWKRIIFVIVFTFVVSTLLVSQADADTTDAFDKMVTNKLKTGGVVKTQIFAQWELWKYKETVIPKKYPFKYCPWESYCAIDKYVIVGGDNKHYLIEIDPALYTEIKPIAEETKAKAKEILKRYKVKGKDKEAYMKIRKYVRSGKDIEGVKSAIGFFEHHGGDCSGYSSAVYVLCKVQGIPVRFVIGSYYGGLLHAWNKVKLGGKWYWVDETLEEPMQTKLWWYYNGVMVMW